MVHSKKDLFAKLVFQIVSSVLFPLNANPVLNQTTNSLIVLLVLLATLLIVLLTANYATIVVAHVKILRYA